MGSKALAELEHREVLLRLPIRLLVDLIGDELLLLEGDILLFQKRITALSKVLRSHQYMSQVFPVIEEATLPTVVYDSAAISILASSGGTSAAGAATSDLGGTVEVALHGKAASLTDLARQMLAYRDDPRLKKGVITNFQIGAEGADEIAFSATLDMDKKIILEQ